MNTRMNFTLVLMIGIAVILSGCSSGNGPNDAVEKAFEEFTSVLGIPYQNVKYSQLENDGTYAVIQINADFRKDVNSDWIEEEARIEVRKIGKEWQANPGDFMFKMPQRFVQQTQTVYESQLAAQAATQQVIVNEEQKKWDDFWDENKEIIYRVINGSPTAFLQAINENNVTPAVDFITEDAILYNGCAGNYKNLYYFLPCTNKEKVEDSAGCTYIYTGLKPRGINAEHFPPFIYSETHVGVTVDIEGGERYMLRCYPGESEPTKELSDGSSIDRVGATCYQLKKVSNTWKIFRIDGSQCSSNP